MKIENDIKEGEDIMELEAQEARITNTSMFLRMLIDIEKRSREEIFIQQDLKVRRITSKRRKTNRQGVNHSSSTQGDFADSISKEPSGEQTRCKDEVGSLKFYANIGRR